MSRLLPRLLALLVLLAVGPAVAQSGEALRQERLAADALGGGDPAGAVQACESALRLDPGRWECVKYLGLAFELLNRLPEARTSLEAYLAQRARGGLDPDPEVLEVLALVREGLDLAAEDSRGQVRATQALSASALWPIWAIGGGGGGGVHWGRPVDNPGVRVGFAGGLGSGGVLGGGGFAVGPVRILGLAQAELGGAGEDGVLLVHLRALAQAELRSRKTPSGGWLRLGPGLTPTTVRQGGDNVSLPLGGFYLAGGWRLRMPGQSRLLLGPEIELFPAIEGARVGLRVDLLIGPGGG